MSSNRLNYFLLIQNNSLYVYGNSTVPLLLQLFVRYGFINWAVRRCGVLTSSTCHQRQIRSDLKSADFKGLVFHQLGNLHRYVSPNLLTRLTDPAIRIRFSITYISPGH